MMIADIQGHKMKKILIVVDMQKDFVDGALGSKEAVAIVDNAVKKIENFGLYDYGILIIINVKIEMNL